MALDWPRSSLYERINQRLDKMVQQGLEEEVRGLLQQGFSPELRSLKGLNYRYFVQSQLGKMQREEAINLTKRDSRRFAKRQLTWFRPLEDLHWLSVQDSLESVYDQAFSLLEPILKPFESRAK